MAQNTAFVDGKLLIALKESVNAIEKDIKFMNSELKYADYDDLSYEDKKTVSMGIDDGEHAIRCIREFNKITEKYINSFAFTKLDFARLDDRERRSLMKKSGDKYDELYDYYSDMWCVYDAMANYRYVSRIKLIKYCA